MGSAVLASGTEHDAVRGFWAWVAANAAEVERAVRQGGPGRRFLDEEVAAVLRPLGAPGLEVVFEALAPRGVRVVLGARGLERLAWTVVLLEAAFPLLPGWEVVAFRPASSPDAIGDLRIALQGAQSVSPDRVLCQVETDPASGRFDLRLRAPRRPIVEMGGVLCVLDALLGERVVLERLGRLLFHDVWDGHNEPPGWVRLTDLPSLVNSCGVKGCV